MVQRLRAMNPEERDDLKHRILAMFRQAELTTVAGLKRYEPQRALIKVAAMLILTTALMGGPVHPKNCPEHPHKSCYMEKEIPVVLLYKRYGSKA